MKTLPLISLLALSACGTATVRAPDADLEGDLTLDKELAGSDEVAAIVATRAVLDAMVDRRLLVPEPSPDEAHGLGTMCSDGPPAVVWRETDCAGLEGWGLETSWHGCDVEGVGVVDGSMFVSFSEVLIALPEEMGVAQAEEELYGMTAGRGPELVSRYHVELQGTEGGSLSACGTASGPSTDAFAREVIDVDIDGHEARIIWDSASARIGGDRDAMDLSHASVLAQFPRGALVDPYSFEVTAFERDIDSAVASGGVLRQHAWHGDVVGYIDAGTAQAGLMNVDRPDGQEIVELPRF